MESTQPVNNYSSGQNAQMGPIGILSLLHSLPTPSIIIDRDGKVVQSNLERRAHLNASESELGKPFQEVLFCEDLSQAEIMEKVESVFQTNERQFIHEKRFKLFPNWKSNYMNLIISPIPGSAPYLNLSFIDKNENLDLQFQLDLIYELGFIMVRTLNLNSVLYLVLTGITAGPALGFNRALIFLLDEKRETLEGSLGVGPSNPEEAGQIWSRISNEKKFLRDFLSEYHSSDEKNTTPMTVLAKNLSIPMANKNHILVKTVEEKSIFHQSKPNLDANVSKLFFENYNQIEFITIPLLAEDEVLGVIIADNRFNWKPIEEKQKSILSIFANLAGISVKNAYRHKELLETLKETKNASMQLEQANRKLRNIEQHATVGRMAGFVAHEIRNPLANIGGFARSTLKNLDNHEKVGRNAHIIVNEVERLEELLSDVLDYLRDQVPKIEKADLNQLIRDIRELSQMVADQKGVSFELVLDQNIPPISFDHKMIKQAILNILKNAIAHSPHGKPIKILTTLNGREIIIAINNQGPGIVKSSAKKLFEPFYTTTDSGSGLGLTITRRIIEGHRGTITFDSSDTQGTTFYIKLPLT